MSVSFGDAPPTAPARPRPSPEEARRIALTHASSLQIRKALESSVLDSLTHLLDLPTAPPAASTPTRADIRTFKHNLRYFSPSDYDDLITERNILSRCGYTLCPRPRRERANKSRFARAKDGTWVLRETQERFCGEVCARRALWVRVQLSAEPAWMRHEVVESAEMDEVTGAVSGVDLGSGEAPEGWDEVGCGIRLLEEEEDMGGKARGVDDKDVRKLAEDLRGIGIRESGRVVKGGESGGGRDPKEVLADVVERKAEGAVREPGEDVEDDEVAAEAIEGFVPKAKRKV